MDVDGNRVIQEVLTVYPQVIPKVWISYVKYVNNRWISFKIKGFRIHKI